MAKLPLVSLSSVLCMGSHGWEMGVVWGFLGEMENKHDGAKMAKS